MNVNYIETLLGIGIFVQQYNFKLKMYKNI